MAAPLAHRFFSSWVPADCGGFSPSWATCPGTVTIRKLEDFVWVKFPLGGGCSRPPRFPPGPTALGGWGGEGAPRTPGVPPRSRGAAAGPKRSPPRGGGGEGRGRRGQRRRGRSPRRRGRFTSGSPPPRPGGGSWAGGRGSYTPLWDATAPGGWCGQRQGWGPGGLGSAPPPLPAPACVAAAGTPSLHLGGSFVPQSGTRQKAQPLAGVLSRLSSYESRPAAAASLPPGRGLRLRLGLGLRLRLRLGLRLRRVQQPLPAGNVRGGADGGRGSRWPGLRQRSWRRPVHGCRVSRMLAHSLALTLSPAAAAAPEAQLLSLSRSVRGSRLTPQRGGRRVAPSDDVSRLATALLPLPSPSSLQF